MKTMKPQSTKLDPAHRAMLKAIAANGMNDLPVRVALKIRDAISGIVDAGTFIDIGTDGDAADLHPVIDGIEWHLNIAVGLPADEVMQ